MLQRKVLELKAAALAAQPFWTQLPRSLDWRGLRGVKLVINACGEGIEAAIAKVVKAAWQHSRLHFMRNALAHAAKSQGAWSARTSGLYSRSTRRPRPARLRTVRRSDAGKFPELGALIRTTERIGANSAPWQRQEVKETSIHHDAPVQTSTW